MTGQMFWILMVNLDRRKYNDVYHTYVRMLSRAKMTLEVFLEKHL
jgi:hypothetical protein